MCAAVPEPVFPPIDAPERFSDLLIRTAASAGERVTIGALVEAFGRRSQGALMVVLGAPNLVPLPLPGLSALTGIPLFVIALQVVLGRDEPWLPGALARRSFAGPDFRRIAGWLVPRLARIERWVRPRWPSVTGPMGRRALGAVAMALALALILPLPFGNALPGLAMALLGLALMERDGLCAVAALVVAAAGLAVTGLATGAVAGAVLLGWREVF